jgi:hypothetical protein
VHGQDNLETPELCRHVSERALRPSRINDEVGEIRKSCQEKKREKREEAKSFKAILTIFGEQGFLSHSLSEEEQG